MAVRRTDTNDAPVDGVTVKKEGAFQRFADWVSEAMGSPVNIVFWAVLVVTWTAIFAFGGPHLASGTWLPAWFQSQGFNFPLNLVTTAVESCSSGFWSRPIESCSASSDGP